MAEATIIAAGTKVRLNKLGDEGTGVITGFDPITGLYGIEIGGTWYEAPEDELTAYDGRVSATPANAAPEAVAQVGNGNDGSPSSTEPVVAAGGAEPGQ